MSLDKNGKFLAVEVPLTQKEKALLETIPGMTINSRYSTTYLQVSIHEKAEAQEFVEIFHIFSGKLNFTSHKNLLQ